MKRPIIVHGSLLQFAVILLSLVASKTSSAETFTRQSALDRAQQQNPKVAAMRAQLLAAETQRDQADAARWPEVTVDIAIGPSLQADRVPGTAVASTENRYGDVRFNDLSVVFGGKINVLQPLYTFGKIDLRREAADDAIAARRAQTHVTRAEVALQVARLYESFLFARDSERFFEEIRHWLSRTIETTEQRIPSDPDLSENDLLRFQTAQGAAELGLHQARAGREQARAGLVAYLGLAGDSEFSVKEETLATIAAKATDLTSLRALAQKQRPELRALERGRAAFERVAEAEAAGLAPDVFLLGFVSAAYTPGRQIIDTRYVMDPLNHVDPGVLLGLRWKFQGNMAQARAGEQRAKAQELMHQAQWAAQGIPAEVTEAFEDAQRAARDVESGRRSSRQARQWMVRADADFSVGLGDVDEVTDAADAYVRFRVALMEAKFRYNVAMARLARATGTLGRPEGRLYPGKGRS